MEQQFIVTLRSVKKFCLGHKKYILYSLAVSFIFLVGVVLICSLIIGSYQKYVLQPGDMRQASVGLVFGSGVNREGKPFQELQARLDAAAQALGEGRVDKLILSGDNRVESYNEPDAMVKYMVEVKNIPTDKLQADYAGRSTYESCERAAKIFGLEQTIIFTAGSHLPRAIFLCRHFSIETYGISSGVEANNSGRREPLARVKAIFNAYINGEKTILGEPIRF